MSSPAADIDYRTIAQILGYVLMAIMGFLGTILWKDVREIKEKWITRDDLNASQAKSDAQRDARHVENTGNFRQLEVQTSDNFRRLEQKLQQVEDRHNKSALAISERIGQVLVEVAKLQARPQRQDGPDRRRY